MDRWLEVAREAARDAGRLLLAAQGRVSRVETKSSYADLVTETDRAAERAIADCIARRAGPGHEVLGEESFAAGRSRVCTLEDLAAAPRLWVVDPLDGTTNFVHGVPFFAVSIAYLERGETRFGVIYDPVRDAWYEAVRGRRFTENGKVGRVSGEADLRQSLLASGFQYDAAGEGRLNLRQFDAVARQSRNVRALGSAALALALVAAGRLSGFWELRLGPWDVAAGALMVEAAGGRVTHLDGSPFVLGSRLDIAATNGRIHEDLLAVLNRAVGSGISGSRRAEAGAPNPGGRTV
ncbi:MAG TPA: inositol monophosphatase family protein [Bacillota bacterium]